MMVRVVSALLALIFLGGCVTETPEQDKIDPEVVLETKLQVAAGYIGQGEYNRAKEHIQSALKIDKTSARAYGLLAYVFQQEGDFKLAESLYKRAIRYSPDSAAVRVNYGSFLFAQGRFEDAIEQQRAASEDPFYARRAQVFENLGRTYDRVGEFVKAEEAYMRALELNAGEPLALLGVARHRFDQYAYEDAQFYYERFATYAQPTAASAWLCVQLYEKLNKRDKRASCELVLRNLFADSDEFRQFEEWRP